MKKILCTISIAAIIISGSVSIAAATTETPPTGGTWSYGYTWGIPFIGYSNYYQDWQTHGSTVTNSVNQFASATAVRGVTSKASVDGVLPIFTPTCFTC